MTNWLDEGQQQDWRSWLAASTLLEDRLSRDLQQQHGLTMADYEILVRLSEAPEHRVRMSELAQRTLSSRSRLSHQVDRLSEAGVVRREHCAEDRRGAYAALTDHGWAVLRTAAPDHVASVREHLVDVLTANEFRALGEACRKILDHLGVDDSAGPCQAPQGPQPTPDWTQSRS